MKVIKLSVFVLTIAAVGTYSLAQARTSDDTQEFVKKAHMSNQFEIVTSQLAEKVTKDTTVKAFAHHMIADHTKAGTEMKKVLVSVNIPVPSSTLDKKYQNILNDLRKTSGSEFDEKYIEAQQDAHEEAVNLFTTYANDGDNVALKAFARKTLPTLQNHDQEINRISESQ